MSRPSGGWTATRAEAALAVGDLDRAESIVARFEERAARSRIHWSLAVSARCRGLLLAARGDLDGAADALARALAEHECCPVPFERARTLLVHGQVLRRLKQKRQARASLEEALAIFRRLAAERWLRRAQDELARVAVRRAPDELSPTELRIARLAAMGSDEPGDRDAGLPDPEDGGGEPRSRLPQARHPLASAALARP